MHRFLDNVGNICCATTRISNIETLLMELFLVRFIEFYFQMK